MSSEFEYKIEEIKEAELPLVIQQQADQIIKLGEQINEASEAAESAMKRAEEVAKEKVKLTTQKTVIKDLQEVVAEISEAQMSSVDSQKSTFQMIKKLADSSKYLLTLGCTNIATNRLIANQLKNYLAQAQEGELSELARSELNKLIMQLKEQEDVLSKQDTFAKNLREVHNDVVQLTHRQETLELDVKAIVVDNKTLNRQITEMCGTDPAQLKQKLVDCEQRNIVLTHEVERLKNECEALTKQVDRIKHNVSPDYNTSIIGAYFLAAASILCAVVGFFL